MKPKQIDRGVEEILQTLPRDEDGAVRYEDLVFAINARDWMEEETCRRQCGRSYSAMTT